MLKLVKRNRRKKRYLRYLKSPKWKKKRSQILHRDGYRCANCGRSYNLQVHHKTYQHIFNEPLSDLITLCEHCHKKIHQRK